MINMSKSKSVLWFLSCKTLVSTRTHFTSSVSTLDDSKKVFPFMILKVKHVYDGKSI